MDNATAQNILSAYRPNGADSADPLFEPALDQCAADPQLRDWFDAERDFDRRMMQALGEITPPANGKEEVLSTASMGVRDHAFMRRWSLWVLPIAAMLVIGLFLFSALRPHPVIWEPGSELVARLSADRRPLDFEADNMVEVRQWLQDRGAPAPDTVPELLLAARSQGCKLYEDDAGNVVSMLCFELNGLMVHVFVFDEQTRHYATLPTHTWQREGDWNLRAMERDGLLLAVATRGDTRRLDEMW
ncbi:MAG: hypothetical protein JJU29_10100 [Verrucomicrobia bacterium]|nr:hypothetical protein [Verrucomicrobiota bacterium]MCH8510588.1 hypothetical protein [Kiritimatiellia bacterium]